MLAGFGVFFFGPLAPFEAEGSFGVEISYHASHPRQGACELRCEPGQPGKRQAVEREHAR